MTPARKMGRRTFLRGAAGTAFLLAGCGRTEISAARPAPEALPVVQLWGIGGINEATHHRIEARLDALAREKLGLSVKLTMVTRSSYNERLNIAFLQGEAPDLFPIYQQSAFDSLYDSGCLRNLHGYIDEDYLNSLRIPRPLWGCTRRDGDYYGVIQYSETMQFTTCQMRQETADALSIPQGDRLWSWNELHGLLLRMKELYPDRAPLVPHYGAMLNYFGQDSLGDDLGVLVDEDGDNTLTLSCPYEIKVCSSPEEVFSEINKKRDWVLSRQEDAEETKPAKGRKKKIKRAAVKPRDLCRVVATFDWPYDSGDALGTVDLYYDPDYEWHCDGQQYRGAWRRPNYVDGDPEIPEHVKVFRRRWNRAKDILEDEEREKRQTGESWASDESTKNEVGSYFTIQGFDLNYVGVIIGPSVGYDEDRNCIVYRPEMSCDPGVTSSRKDISTSEDLEYFKHECIRKQLGVLTKRGVHGLYLFAVDPVLQKKLQDSMSV